MVIRCTLDIPWFVIHGCNTLLIISMVCGNEGIFGGVHPARGHTQKRKIILGEREEHRDESEKHQLFFELGQCCNITFREQLVHPKERGSVRINRTKMQKA